MTIVPIRRALISVSDKTGLIPFGAWLHAQNISIYSTGGTAKALEAAGIPIIPVETYTGMAESCDGRLKTLHPKVHGGLLAVRDHPQHMQDLAALDGVPIDLLVVSLYPFEAGLERGSAPEDLLELIDIGGPAMLRSAAKNHASVAVLCDPRHYAVLQEAVTHHGGTTLALRRTLAAQAFAHTAAYDAVIAQWTAAHWADRAIACEIEGAVSFPERMTSTLIRAEILRYGENPHQEAAVYRIAGKEPGPILGADLLQGKPSGYNTLLDSEASWRLLMDLPHPEHPAIVIVKHGGPCGVAVDASLHTAWCHALACDSVSAFGGVVAVRGTLDATTAEAMTSMFLEVVLLQSWTEDARAILAKKPNLRVFHVPATRTSALWRSAPLQGGVLLQTLDQHFVAADDLARNPQQIVTKRTPSAPEWEGLLFAERVAAHVRSNAIVIAAGMRTIGIGGGQPSRVDSVRIALERAQRMGLSLQGAALASDGFFPFADGVELAAQAGISAILQPGQSIRDAEVIAMADHYNVAMVCTGVRHFFH